MYPMVWSVGSVPKRREVVHACSRQGVSSWSGWYLRWVGGSLVLPLLLPVKIMGLGLFGWHVGAHCTGLKVRLVLGLVVFLLWKCSFCMSCGLVRGWIWRRLCRGTAGQVAQFQCRLFLLVQAFFFGASFQVHWALFRALDALPGGTRRFVPCDVGAIHCRLRHIGRERCDHGLTSRPRESASRNFLNELLASSVLFW